MKKIRRGKTRKIQVDPVKKRKKSSRRQRAQPMLGTQFRIVENYLARWHPKSKDSSESPSCIDKKSMGYSFVT
jgi:hypothetical protein